MVTAYINAALRKAHYEILPDGEGYFGSIEGLQGVWAQADALEACRCPMPAFCPIGQHSLNNRLHRWESTYVSRIPWLALTAIACDVFGSYNRQWGGIGS